MEMETHLKIPYPDGQKIILIKESRIALNRIILKGTSDAIKIAKKLKENPVSG